MTNAVIVILIVAGFILLLVMISYNSLIVRKNKVTYAFSSTDTMLKKRHDLIPNIVESVKQYMNFEKGLLTDITKLRSDVMDEKLSDQQRFDIENKISGALGKIKVAVENYPDLKANQNFMQLQSTLNEIEDQISAARRAFNAAILDYNNAVQQFPSNIIAGMFCFKTRASFEIPPEERENVNVKNLFNS
jgi:LemA protein